MTARVIFALGLASALAVLVSSAAGEAPRHELDGRAPARATHVAGVQAAFEKESYRPGDRARLVVDHRSRDLSMQVFESGPERAPTSSDSLMSGVPVTRERSIGGGSGRRTLTVKVGRWHSGLYFVRLRAPNGTLGFAPFVVAPRRIGEHRVAIVLPTLTWQAYNFRADRDGRAGSWYVDKRVTSVRLGRAFLDRGVPYGLRNHLGFLTWLQQTGRQADYLSQWDLEQVSQAATLENAYDLIVFAGHHEYVTTEEYDLVEGYRDLGGNLMFLSANNFFWRVERKSDLLVKSSRWRHLGRPEAALVGVQYVGNHPSPRGACVVRKTPARSWLFAGTALRVGQGFGRGGVEIDQVTGASPPSVRVVAEIPRLFGPGMKAQMTYYETGRGARVFAAGAFHLTRSVTSDPVLWRMLENLWARMVER